MKKIIVTIAIAFSSLGAFANSEEVSARVLDAFNTDFNTAKDVAWTVADNYYKASFTYNDKCVFAYYNKEGELMGLTRYISPVDLPLVLQTSLKKNYTGYWVSDLFEVAKNDGTSYYITLENADTKIILKASDGSEWSVYQKIRKA